MEEVQSKGASRDSRGCSITVQSEVFPINHNHSYVGYPSCISIFRYISIYFHILPYVSIIFYIYIYVCVCTYISYMYPILPTKKHIQTMASMAAGRLQSCRRDPAKSWRAGGAHFPSKRRPWATTERDEFTHGKPKNDEHIF